MKSIYLSVIIPAYNEEANIKRGSLNQVLNYLESQTYSWELILVNDGSNDSTLELLTKYSVHNSKIKLIDNTHQGKAQGIITGVLAATGRRVLFADMDQATPISQTDKILDQMDSGCDIVIGSRSGRKGAPLFRQVLALGMVLLRTVILRLPFKDTQCGFKAFTDRAAKQIFTIMKRLRPKRVVDGPAVDPGFDVELLYLGRKLDFKICEVPVEWHYQESRRVRFVYDAISGMTGLLLVRWRALSGAYGL